MAAFRNLLSGESITAASSISPLNGSQEVFFDIAKAIQDECKSDFLSQYEVKSKSRPNADSPAPFIHDDFLLFSLLVGIEKFAIETEWIQYIVSVRPRNAVTITFENIINKNFESTSNLPEVVFSFLHLSNAKEITPRLIDFTYETITSGNWSSSPHSDFQQISALHAYDLIVKLKTAPPGSDIYYWKTFDQAFAKRMEKLAWLIQFGLFAGIIYLLISLPNYSPEVVSFFEKYNYIFTLLGAFGITLLGNRIRFFKNWLTSLVMQLFGYPKGLLKLRESKLSKQNEEF